MEETLARLDPVAAVRHFNRFYTHAIGLLADQHLGSGLTLGQARVLFEIGRLTPVETRALQHLLGLDPGYLSRMLSDLEAARLIQRSSSPNDRRAKRVSLTRQGRKKLAVIDDRSDAVAMSLIGGLPDRDRQRLVDAMAEIQRLLGDGVRIGPEAADSPDAKTCLQAYYKELAERFPSGFDPASTVSAEPEEVGPPYGTFLVARYQGRPVGCGAVKTLEPGVGEIKRMWVDPRVRGRGVGRRLLADLEASARQLGFGTLRLDSRGELTEALALYRKAGYREVPAYNDNRYATHWFEKRLNDGIANAGRSALDRY